MHDNADVLKNRAESVKTQVSSNFFHTLAIVFYWSIIYMMRAIEYAIQKLQMAMGLLKSQSVKARENLASRKAAAKTD